jgi:hypothetical protein
MQLLEREARVVRQTLTRRMYEDLSGEDEPTGVLADAPALGYHPTLDKGFLLVRPS